MTHSDRMVIRLKDGSLTLPLTKKNAGEKTSSERTENGKRKRYPVINYELPNGNVIASECAGHTFNHGNEFPLSKKVRATAFLNSKKYPMYARTSKEHRNGEGSDTNHRKTIYVGKSSEDASPLFQQETGNNSQSKSTRIRKNNSWVTSEAFKKSSSENSLTSLF